MFFSAEELPSRGGGYLKKSLQVLLCHSIFYVRKNNDPINDEKHQHNNSICNSGNKHDFVVSTVLGKWLIDAAPDFLWDVHVAPPPQTIGDLAYHVHHNMEDNLPMIENTIVIFSLFWLPGKSLLRLNDIILNCIICCIVSSLFKYFLYWPMVAISSMIFFFFNLKKTFSAGGHSFFPWHTDSLQPFSIN